jgi:hypothetical protein
MSSEKNPGYHLAKIKRGRVGQVSKIQEEVDELADAHDQGSKILCLVELADIYGAMQMYIETNHPGTTMNDIHDMASITARAFRSGKRKSRDD